MKNWTFLFVFALFLSLGTIISSCGHSHDHSSGEGIAKTSKEYASVFVCPMHCKGSGGDEAGTCPKCKMDYVKNPDHKAAKSDSHEGHGHDHDGHNHSGKQEGHEH